MLPDIKSLLLQFGRREYVGLVIGYSRSCNVHSGRVSYEKAGLFS